VTQQGVLALLPTAFPDSGQQTESELGRRATSSRPCDARIEPGHIIGGRYEIAAFVAEGAFGAVYRANDLDVAGHVVALKVAHRPPASDAERERYQREVQLIAAVSHPSVVSFKDHGWHRGRVYIVMPWYEGETLAQRVAREPLSRAEAERVFRQLADALAAMHARGIRHQDVKPENVLLARFGENSEAFPVLLDLGVGAFGAELWPAFTPAYVAPEMARAHLELCHGGSPSPVDGKADVFSLALTLIDALSPGARDLARCSSSPAALLARATEGVSLPDDPTLADIRPALARWLAVDPSLRPTVQGFAHELCVLTREERRRAERKRLLLRFGPMVACVLSIVAMLAVQLRRERVQSHVKDLRIEDQAAQIDEVRTALTSIDGARRTRERELSALVSENRALEQRFEAERAVLQRALGKLESERASLGRELTRLSVERDELVQRLDAEAHARGAMQERVSELEEERAALVQELLRLEAQQAVPASAPTQGASFDRVQPLSKLVKKLRMLTL
jgi:serine/threonine protein kinase